MRNNDLPRIVIPIDLKRRMVEVARQLRLEHTASEDILWQALRNRKLDGWKFRRQFPLGPFVLDFYCAEARLAVEVDGAIHLQQIEADTLSQSLIEEVAIHFVRVTADEVERDLLGTLAKLRAALGGSTQG